MRLLTAVHQHVHFKPARLAENSSTVLASMIDFPHCLLYFLMSLCLRLLGLKALTKPGLLRKGVVDTLDSPANKMDWAMAMYRGKLAK